MVRLMVKELVNIIKGGCYTGWAIYILRQWNSIALYYEFYTVKTGRVKVPLKCMTIPTAFYL